MYIIIYVYAETGIGTVIFHSLRNPVAQRWPANLEVHGLIPTEVEIFSNLNRIPLPTAFHYLPPDVTEILLKKT